MLIKTATDTREDGKCCCAFSRHSKTLFSRPNKTGADQQIALRSLIGDAKRAIGKLAAAEGRLLSIHDELFGRAWQLGKLLAAISARRDFARIDNAAC